jgi:hypothetical protein
MSKINKSKKEFLEFEIRKNWMVLIEIDDADDGMISFWLKHKDYGIINHIVGYFKQDFTRYRKEESLEMRGFKTRDLNYDDEESVLEFSNIFLYNLIDEDIEIYIDDVFTEDEKDNYFGEDY